MRARARSSTRSPRISGAGVVGMLLAAVGVYGVTAYTVTRRTREIGIRLSLGADRFAVIYLVLRQGMRLVAFGTGMGMLMAASAGVLLQRSPVPPPDMPTYAATATLFCWSVVPRAICRCGAPRASARWRRFAPNRRPAIRSSAWSEGRRTSSRARWRIVLRTPEVPGPQSATAGRVASRRGRQTARASCCP